MKIVVCDDDALVYEQMKNIIASYSIVKNENLELTFYQTVEELLHAKQKLVVYLLLEDALEWKCGISGLPIQTSAPSPEPAHRGRAESYPEYAAKESHAWNDRTVAAASQTGLYPLPGKPVPSYAQTGDIPADKGQNALQAKTIRADAVSRPACAGGYESGTAEMPGKSGRTVISVYSD